MTEQLRSYGDLTQVLTFLSIIIASISIIGAFAKAYDWIERKRPSKKRPDRLKSPLILLPSASEISHYSVQTWHANRTRRREFEELLHYEHRQNLNYRTRTETYSRIFILIAWFLVAFSYISVVIIQRWLV